MMLDCGRRHTIPLKELNPRTNLDAKAAPSLIDQMRVRGQITQIEWRAACKLRDLYFEATRQHSEGVGSYDDANGGSDITCKADRNLILLIYGDGTVRTQIAHYAAKHAYTRPAADRSSAPRLVAR
jgi:hypothetical protein